MKMIKAFCVLAILIAAIFSGCIEKQAGEDSLQGTESDAENVTAQAEPGVQTPNDSTFLKDFNLVNDPYKKALFATGQGQRNDSIRYYTNLTESLAAFQEKYKDLRPLEIQSDKQFSSDMMNVSAIVSGAKDDVYTGNLTEAHIRLEAVRPIFQEILVRNNLMSLGVALVDFHDVMEEVLDAANNKDAAGVIDVYPRADKKLSAVEAISNESGIKAIRANLDEVENLAQENKTAELPAKASDLKTSYVKVYLATSLFGN
jgi:hypothetical protein